MNRIAMGAARACLALALVCLAPAFAAVGDPAGGEFLINTTDTGANFGAVALDGAGNFVAVWQGFDGNNSGAFLRRYAADGTARAAQALANSDSTAGFQGVPAVAAAPDGRFVVVWNGQGSDDGNGIWARVFDAAGVAQTASLRVNETVSGTDSNPGVAIDRAGNFVVGWTHTTDAFVDSMQARRFDAAGVPRAGEFEVAPYPSNFAGTMRLAGDLDGNFVAVWGGFDGDCSGIFGRRFGADGSVLGDLVVSTTIAGCQDTPAIAMNAAGEFVVAWLDQAAEVRYRRYDGNGAPRADEQATATTVEPSQPGVALDGAGNFVLIWNDNEDNATAGIFGRRFDAAGAPLAGTFHVNTSTTGAQLDGAIGMDGKGDFVVVWQSNHVKAGRQPYGQRYEGAPADAVPASFKFGDRTGVATGTVFHSNLVTVAGINVPVALTLTGPGSAGYSINDGSYVTGPGVVVAGDTVRLKVRSAGQVQTARVVSLDLGGVHDNWSVTTGNVDTTPDPPGFADVTGAAPDTTVASNVVTIAGINTPVPVSIAGGTATGEFSVDGGPFTRTATSLAPGQTLQLRLRSARLGNQRLKVKVHVGTIVAAFAVTTAP